MIGLPVRASALVASVSLAGLLGCSALVNPDSDLLGRDPNVDSGVLMLMDSGVGSDGGGVMCTEGTSRCAGDTLFTCAGGMELARDCQTAGAFCQGGQCVPHVCTPNQRECSSGANAVLSCSARGHEVTRDACPSGCDPALIACRPDGRSCEEGIDAIEIGGRRRVNLCEGADDSTHEPAEGCRSTMRADVADRVFSLTIERRQEVTIELTDVDPARAIDTIVYIRRTCDDMESQVGCGDDVPCAESTAEPTACFGEVDLRQSRTTVVLDAGTYYIVVDGFEYRTDRVSFGCGEVELRVERSSPFPFP